MFGRVRLGHRQFEPIVDLKRLNRFLGPFGLWSGVAPDGLLHLLVRDISTQEIYALDGHFPCHYPYAFTKKYTVIPIPTKITKPRIQD
jgi:hypothetical protein